MPLQHECKVEMKNSVADMSYPEDIFAFKHAFNFPILKMKEEDGHQHSQLCVNRKLLER